MPMDVLASDDELVKGSLFQSLFQGFRHVLEMVQDLIIHAAFGVAGIVPSKAVAAAAPGESMEKGLVLLDFVEMQIKEPGPVTIQKGHP